MTPPPHRCLRRLGEERGQVSVFLVVLLPACLLFLGLILDGGQALAVKTRAIGQAQEAARAGAQELDLTRYRATGRLRLDPTRARASAEYYLHQLGATGTATATTATVQVTVTTTTPTRLLDLAGIPRISITGRGQAAPDPGPGAAPGTP